ncbi:MAG: hypothetical protein ACBR50_22055 [Microcoleus sp.]
MDTDEVQAKVQEVLRSPPVKILRGIAGIAGGATTAGGGGIIGGFLNSHGMRSQAMLLGREQIKMGGKLLAEGWEELKVWKPR